MVRFFTVVGFVCLTSLVQAAPIVNSGFEKVPTGALMALKVSNGKAFRSGAVFVNGHYIEPPYKVSRYGTALVVNGQQVTGQVIKWDRFLATCGSGTPVASTTTEKAEPVAEAVVSTADSLDDLFDDAPTPKKTAPTRSTTVSAAPAVSYANVNFVMNPTAQGYLDTINKNRSALDRGLRDGKFFFFGKRYSRVEGDSRLLLQLIKVLPELLRDSVSGDDLHSKLSRAGIHFLNPAICVDLFANRVDYLKLSGLRDKLKEKEALDKALNNGDSLTL